MASLRRGRICCATLFCALLAACAHVPESPAGRGAPELASDSAIPTPPDPAVPTATPDDLEPATPVAEVDDLLERMRAGFALEAVDQPSVDRKLDWYRHHSAYLERSFGRARPYLHHIVEALEERDMPLELALLPIVESSFDPFAYSSCGAAGLWQFMDRTGRTYGLHSSWWYEGRRDVVEATRAALDYLQALHDEFDGDWLLALAAYNAGGPNVRRAMERARRRGLPTDFFHLALPRETRAYVPDLLALSRLVAEPALFGLELPQLPNTPYFTLVPLDGQLDLNLAAELMGISLDELRALNPAFEREATAPHDPARLVVPIAARERFERALEELPPNERLRFAHHRVRHGDTLGAIGRRYRVSVEALRRANHLSGTLIRVGQDLLVPLSYRHVTVASASRSRASRRSTAARRRAATGSLDAGL